MISPADLGYPHSRSTAARVGGLLLVIGGSLALTLLATVPGFVHGHTTPTFVTAGTAVLVGAFCMANARRIPAWFLPVIGPLGIVLIATSSILTRTTTDGSELLYLWPVLFSAYFLSWRAALFNVCLLAVVYPPVAISIIGAAGITPSVYMVGTSVVTLAVTMSLRRQITRVVTTAALEARTDTLTQLPNRRSWDDGLTREVALRERRSSPLCVLMIDLDRFKQLNDAHGHAAGDAALVLAARVLRAQARQTDLLARIGGEEFALALPDCVPDDGAQRAEQIRVAIAETSASHGRPLTASIGVAGLPAHATTRSELMAAADAALYEAKRSGRNAVRVSAEPVPGPRRCSGLPGGSAPTA
jgi:diguanylate cyclase (GGDEF)-like protein